MDNEIEFTTALISPNTTSEFEKYLNKENIEHKRIRVATPRHNGKVERVHRMDNERFHPNRKFYSVEDVIENTKLVCYNELDN